MLSSHLALHRRLDDLALEALGPPPPLPVARVAELEVSIEVIYEDEAAIDELATTNPFVRLSAPYERVELAEIEEMPSLAALSARPATFARRPTRFARTITAAQRAITANERTSLERAATELAAAELAAADQGAAATRRMAAAEYPAAPAGATVPFERVWFEDDEDRLAEIEEKPAEVKASWWWLAISIAAGGVAVAWMASLAG